MSSLREKISNWLDTLPAIFVMTFVNVFISSCTAGVVMIQMLANWAFCRNHSWIALGVAILIAIGTNLWIVFNHKLREYIRVRSLYE